MTAFMEKFMTGLYRSQGEAHFLTLIEAITSIHYTDILPPFIIALPQHCSFPLYAFICRNHKNQLMGHNSNPHCTHSHCNICCISRPGLFDILTYCITKYSYLTTETLISQQGETAKNYCASLINLPLILLFIKHKIHCV